MSWANNAKGAQGISFGPLVFKETIGARHMISPVKRTCVDFSLEAVADFYCCGPVPDVLGGHDRAAVSYGRWQPSVYASRNLLDISRSEHSIKSSSHFQPLTR